MTLDEEIAELEASCGLQQWARLQVLKDMKRHHEAEIERLTKWEPTELSIFDFFVARHVRIVPNQPLDSWVGIL